MGLKFVNSRFEIILSRYCYETKYSNTVVITSWVLLFFYVVQFYDNTFGCWSLQPLIPCAGEVI